MTIGPGTPVYPGDPVPRLRVHATVARDGFNLLHVEMGSQSGTHVDAPFHFSDAGARVDALDLAMFTGPAFVVDATDAGPRGVVGADRVTGDGPRAGDVVLVRTGWSAHAGTEQYLDHPALGEDLVSALIAAGVRTVGIDALSVDHSPTPEHPLAGFPAHDLLTESGAVIIENLVGLDRLAGMRDPLICAFPMKLADADGAPVRAVAIEFGA